MKVKKIILTVLLLLTFSMVAFLMFSDPGTEEKLNVAFAGNGEVKHEKEKSKAQIITDDIKKKKEQEAEQERMKAQKKKEETKLEFDNLFRKDEPAKEVVKEKEIKLNSESENLAKTNSPERTNEKREVVSKNRPRSGTPKKKEESATEEASILPGQSFSTVDGPAQKTVEANNKKGATSKPKNFVKVGIYGDYGLKQNMKVEFIALESFEVDGVMIKANTVFEGIVKSIGQRVTFKISNIGNVIHGFEILDVDYEPGIFNNAYVDNTKVFKETSNDVENSVISSSGISEFVIASEILKGGKKMVDKKTEHVVYLENGNEYFMKY